MTIPCRPLNGDSIYADAHWVFPNSVLTARCMAWNPQRESELYLLVNRGILRSSAHRLLPGEVALPAHCVARDCLLTVQSVLQVTLTCTGC